MHGEDAEERKVEKEVEGEGTPIPIERWRGLLI
jgi:hypothetical protein